METATAPRRGIWWSWRGRRWRALFLERLSVIVGTAEATRIGFVSSKKQWHSLKSTNALLSDPTLSGVTGVKTGKTGGAGECLIASWIWSASPSGGQGREIFGVVLGSEDRFSEMKEIFSWVRRSFLLPL